MEKAEAKLWLPSRSTCSATAGLQGLMMKLAVLPRPIITSTTIQARGSSTGSGSSRQASTRPMRRTLTRPIRSERCPMSGDVKVWAKAEAAKQRPI